MLNVATALGRQADRIVEDSGRLLELRRVIESPADLTTGQWLQLYALALDFEPDLIVELGRGYGNSTCVFVEAAHRGGAASVVSIGFDTAHSWHSRTVPRLRDRLGAEWFEPLDAIERDILEVDFEPILARGQRVLLFWDAHGEDLAEYLLANAIPHLERKEHVVVVHDVDDVRYDDVANDYVRPDGLRTWWQGPLSCPFEEIVPLFDFISRNRIAYATPQESLHTLRAEDPAAFADLVRKFAALPPPSPLDEGHWMAFSLKDAAAERIVYPTFSKKRGRVGTLATKPISADGHHPVFTRFRSWEGYVPAGYDANWLGVMTRTSFFNSNGDAFPARFDSPWPPPLDKDYFAWIAVLEAVVAARDHFTMIELGAGWGRWLVNAAAAVNQYSGLPYSLIGVEAEPTHFRWMELHMRDNEIPRRSTLLFNAAIAAADGTVAFEIGDASEWYGQSIVGEVQSGRFVDRLKPGQRLPTAPTRGRTVARVRAVTLARLLRTLEAVDLLDVDIQGAEADVLEAGATALDEKVRRVHVTTHGDDNEERLRQLLGGLGWQRVTDYAAGTQVDTPYGRIDFSDGVQSWLNPHR